MQLKSYHVAIIFFQSPFCLQLYMHVQFHTNSGCEYYAHMTLECISQSSKITTVKQQQNNTKCMHHSYKQQVWYYKASLHQTCYKCTLADMHQLVIVTRWLYNRLETKEHITFLSQAVLECSPVKNDKESSRWTEWTKIWCVCTIDMSNKICLWDIINFICWIW